MKHLALKSLFGIALVAITISPLLGCRKKGDTTVKITVRDTLDKLVVGALVRLDGQATIDSPKAIVRHDTAYTNTSGVATFNYNEVYQLGQAGVAVLNITAEKDGMKGTGIIKVEEEKVSSQTVYVQN
jgi:hypothetical protein